MKMLELVVPYLVESEAPKRFQKNEPDYPGWRVMSAIIRNPVPNSCLSVHTPCFATVL